MQELDHCSEVTEVPEDSEDAKKWPIWRPTTNDDASTAPTYTPPSHDVSAPQLSNATASEMAQLSPAPETQVKLPPRRPGPRKPRTSLAPLPSSSTQKAKKLTTLDKSAIDWRSHVAAEAETGIKDELEANRKGGGYLEKVEFLERVGQRKESILDAEKSAKRRRG